MDNEMETGFIGIRGFPKVGVPFKRGYIGAYKYIRSRGSQNYGLEGPFLCQ